MEISKISKSPLVTENYKQIVLALKWSFEKCPNFHSTPNGLCYVQFVSV
jgi:hypothetical protein